MNVVNKIIQLYQRTIDTVFFELNKSAVPGGVVFLGDSITDFFRINEYFHGVYVINRGISGDTTDGVLFRLPESVYDLHPSKVFLLIGTNDIVEDKKEEDILLHIEQIIAAIHINCPDTKVYLESIYPVSTLKHKKVKKVIVGKRTNEMICRINEKLERLAQDMDITYIDVYSHLVDETGNLRLEYTVEGLHLTVEGYRAAAAVLKPYVLE